MFEVALIPSEVFREWAQILLSFATICTTIILGWLTIRLSRETKTLAERSTQPFVVCTIESIFGSPTAMQQSIRNTGNATAFDIIVELKPGLPEPNSQKEQGGRKVVSLLYPGQSLSVDGVLSTDIYEKTFRVHISWSDAPASKLRHVLVYDLSTTDGFRAGWRRSGQHEIAESLGKIHSDLESMTSGYRRLKVDAYLQSVRDQEREERDRERQEFLIMNGQDEAGA